MDIINYYVESGAGEPLLLLHGNGESTAHYANQIEVFSKYFRVVALAGTVLDCHIRALILIQ